MRFDAVERGVLLHRRRSTRVRGTNDPRNLVFPFYMIPARTRRSEPDVLPTPNLDDRRFQDLVDDAKRMVQQRCPEWTDHNVSDPGVTLIETFAFMADQLLYRLNRVPDRLYVTFLDLLGVTLHPPTAGARRRHRCGCPRRQPEDGRRAGRDARSRRCAPSSDEAVVFATTGTLTMPPRTAAARADAGGAAASRCAATTTLGLGDASSLLRRPARSSTTCCCSASTTRRRRARSSCGSTATSRASASTRGTRRWSGRRGTARPGSACEVDSDGTGGLNRPGDVVAARAARRHTASVLGGPRARAGCGAAWCPPIEGYPFYSASPTDHGAASAFTIGGTVAGGARRDRDRRGARAVRGRARAGVPARAPARWSPTARRSTSRSPPGPGWDALDRGRLVRRAATREDHGAPRSTAPTGEVQLRARRPRARRHAARRTAPCRPRARRCGCRATAPAAGPRGNVAGRRRSRVLRVAPCRSSTGSRTAAPRIGGVAAETVERGQGCAGRSRCAPATGPSPPRTTSSSPAPRRRGVARVRCVAGASDGRRRGRRAGAGRARRRLPTPTGGCGSRTWCRPPSARGGRASTSTSAARSARGCVVEPPFYQGVTVVARSPPGPGRRADELQREARRARSTATSTRSRGGPDGAGWPFGRPGPGRRGVRRAAAAARHRARRGGPALRGRPAHRPARRARAAHRPRRARAGLLVRPPGPGVGGSPDVRGMVEGLTSPVPVARPAARRAPGRRVPAAVHRRVRRRPRAGLPHARRAGLLRRPAPRARRLPDWLCGWVGIEPDDSWTTERRREIVARRRVRAPPARHGARDRGGRAAGRRGRRAGARQRRLRVVGGAPRPDPGVGRARAPGAGVRPRRGRPAAHRARHRARSVRRTSRSPSRSSRRSRDRLPAVRQCATRTTSSSAACAARTSCGTPERRRRRRDPRPHPAEEPASEPPPTASRTTPRCRTTPRHRARRAAGPQDAPVAAAALLATPPPAPPEARPQQPAAVRPGVPEAGTRGTTGRARRARALPGRPGVRDLRRRATPPPASSAGAAERASPTRGSRRAGRGGAGCGGPSPRTARSPATARRCADDASRRARWSRWSSSARSSAWGSPSGPRSSAPASP